MASNFSLKSYPHSCMYCGYTSRFLSLLLRHYRIDHESDPCFKIICGISSCCSTYTNIASWQKHIVRKHKEQSKALLQVKGDESNSSDIATIKEANSDCDLSPLHQSETSVQSSLMNELQKFILSLRVKKYVSENVTELIVQKFEGIARDCLVKTQKIAENNGNLSSAEVINICDPLQSLVFSLEDVNTTQKQNKLFHRKPFVSPISHKLGHANEAFVYVPVLETLKNLLAHDDVLSYFSSQTTEPSTIQSFATSSKFKESSFFKHPYTLQLELYMDDFTLTNPLGSSAKKHKICALYFTLGNLPYYLKSKLYTIQLIGLVPNQLVKRYGFNKILEPFINDIQTLETEGLNVRTSAGLQIFFGTISVLIADNLASHELGGFVASFSGFRRCRFCNATNENMQSCFNEKEFILRSPSSYDAQVAQVEKNSFLSSTYGIKASSALNQLNFFHICWGSPSDISHDLFEGVCLDLVKVVLEHAIDLKVITLCSLNDDISKFPFTGRDTRNKPAIIVGTATNIVIKQSAAQCHNLVKLLPLILGPKMPMEDPYWKCYICFLRCLDYILAPALHAGEILFMEELITDFITCYSRLRRVTNIKPKMHFMIHYGTQYRVFGALINYSTLRFEAKHSNLKSYFNNCKNYKNPCLTIANRHQYLQALHCSNYFYINEDNLTISKKCKNIPLVALPTSLVNQLSNITSENSNIIFYKFIEFNSIIYRKGQAVVVNIDSEDMFALIEEVMFLHGTIYLILCNAIIIDFKAHMNAYIIEVKDSKFIKEINTLPSKYTLPVYEINGEKCVHLHHYITDCI